MENCQKGILLTPSELTKENRNNAIKIYKDY
jgi:hypothetical protein